MVEKKKKVGVYVHKDLWKRFKAATVKDKGSLRAVSKCVEEAIRLWLKKH